MPRGRIPEKRSLCYTTDCYREVESKGGEYCYHCRLEREKGYCKNPRCHEKIFKSEKLCSNCKNDKDAVRLTSCNTCHLNYYYGDKYGKCSYHSKFCLSLSCRSKIPEYMNYCSEHINSCLTCSSRIASSQEYCKVHQETEQLKSLVQQRTSLSNPQEIVQFNTWWNNNLATLINGDYSYTLWLLVYEPAERNRAEILQRFEVSQGYDKSSLVNVKNKAGSVRNELNGDNPILAIHSQANSYVSFSNLITSPYVIKRKLPVGIIDMGPIDQSGGDVFNIDHPNNPDDYLKPLDIVKIDKSILLNRYFHFGIYLGNKQICHFTDPYSKNKDTRDTNRIVITDWNRFLDGGGFDLIRIHPLIPFKHYQKIAKNIAWDESNRYGEGRYCLANNNCEHYANSSIFGLNWSEQVAERPSKVSSRARYAGINNGKSSFNLESELEKYVSELDNWRSQEIERQYLQEVPAKQGCKIM